MHSVDFFIINSQILIKSELSVLCSDLYDLKQQVLESSENGEDCEQRFKSVCSNILRSVKQYTINIPYNVKKVLEKYEAGSKLTPKFQSGFTAS